MNLNEPTSACNTMLRSITPYLVNEHDSGDDLCDTLIYIALDNLVHLSTKLVGDLCPTTFHKASHDAHDILSTLRPGIRGIEVTKSDVLHKFFSLVHVPFW